MSSSMRDVKCAAARGVIEALEGFAVLYVESFVLDEWHARWRRWGTQFSDDLQVLIPHEQLEGFMDRMEAGEDISGVMEEMKPPELRGED